MSHHGAPTKVGEGSTFKEEEIPIDILYSRLIEWLVDRKKMPTDWRKRLAQVQARAVAAFRSLDPALTSGMEAEELDHAGCKLLLDKVLLDGGKSAARGLLGLGKRGGIAGELEAVLQAYKRHGLHFGETAMILSKYTDYEVPYLRKQIAKSQQQLKDLQRKEVDYKRNIGLCAVAYTSACSNLGIPGNDHVRELRELPRQLSEVFQTVQEGLRSEVVGEAVEYYQAFVRYAHSGEGEALLTTLLSMRSDDGLEDGDADDFVVVDNSDVPGADQGAAPVEIDWGISMDEPAQTQDSAAAPVEIDWGAMMEEAAQGDDGAPAAAVEIDWGISMDEAGHAASDSCEGSKGKHTRLAEPGRRNRLVEDLFELKAFLGMRKQQLASAESATAALSSASVVVQQQSIEGTERMHEAVADILDTLTCRRTQDLLLIQAKGRYLERLVATLDSKKGQEAKIRRAIVDLDKKREEVRGELTSAAAREKTAQGRMSELKKFLEQELSQQYKGRPVNLIGEINNIIGY